MHDPLSSADLASDELRQRREIGYDIDHLAADLARISPDDTAALEVLYQALLRSRQRPSGRSYGTAGRTNALRCYEIGTSGS